MDICDCPDDYLQADAEESTVRVKTDSLNALEICLNPPCKEKTGQTFPFRAAKGTDIAKVGRKTS
ncbi:hypothetical protein NXW50_30905 [Bacteroides thetaiotaomicron]|nr:hypothetical protein [Bacteroides thetaiotaomicron]MCS2282377.1 hypothetical protein [Bacteroides thetaiotaomicron]